MPDPTRQQAREAALEAFGIERKFTNFYSCEKCCVEWETTWSCACDDECPECQACLTPYDYEIEDEHEEEESPT